MMPFLSFSQDWHATVPYQCNFEDPIENGAWILLNVDTLPNHWVIDTGANHTTKGTKALYISSDG